MAKLLLKFKEAILKEIRLEKKVTTIGRAHSNDIVIDNLVVSGAHARIVNEGGRYFIEDTNSTNGTFLSGRRITKSPLANHAQIAIGEHTLVFVNPAAVEDADATIVNLKAPAVDATMMIDTRKARTEATLEQAANATAPLPAAAQKPEIVGGFTVIAGSTDKREYELLKRVTTIGKADSAEIKLKGLFAPKIAALVNRTRDGYYLSPASGEKHPVVNNKYIASAVLLKNLDLVEVAGLKLQFYIKD
ncbi:MAG: hypothetical protein A2005_11905 [Desulfuromonadales bacterium GWC2_61_20]|nr:MAG: hypothetical protein A2005_11905 [Desulfuromonadales bacterium GWC2_61_20]HAD03744.1 hypothetical protein [Desulfuromonas sp.]HBT84070.1 hypothetical protein [Desulfuromonas sp.]